MSVTSPIDAADAARAAYRMKPEGGVGVVSGSGDENLFGRLAQIAGGFLNRTAATTADLLKPGNLFVPGGSKVAVAAAETARNTSSVVAAAGEGIKAGFSKATLVITLVLAFVVWRLLR